MKYSGYSVVQLTNLQIVFHMAHLTVNNTLKIIKLKQMTVRKKYVIVSAY